MNNAEYFTQEELSLISDALISAIKQESECAVNTFSKEAAELSIKMSRRLRDLNTKVCNLMQEE